MLNVYQAQIEFNCRLLGNIVKKQSIESILRVSDDEFVTVQRDISATAMIRIRP